MNCPLPARTRLTLSAVPTLAVWTVPPSRQNLLEAVEHSGAKRILFFGNDPGLDTPQSFLTRLAGLVRYCIHQRQGQTATAELAAATAQREATVEIGLQWLAAKGFITLIRQGQGRMQAAEGGKSWAADLPKIENQLKIILQETAAFRSYYLRADLNALVEAPALVKLQSK